MTEGSTVDERYYESVKPSSVAERVLTVARDRIYDDFLRLIRPVAGETILDVGASDVITEAANTLERKYPHPEAITAVGLGTAAEFQATFPDVRYQQIEPNVALPFPAKCFSVAMSNAVLEHVGSADNQAAFVAELTRVAERVFISVPHRFFPVEHHTSIPLAHYTDASFAMACRALNKSDWAEPANLILMSKRRLAAAVPPGRRFKIGYTGLWLGPFSSNLYLLIDQAA